VLSHEVREACESGLNAFADLGATVDLVTDDFCQHRADLARPDTIVLETRGSGNTCRVSANRMSDTLLRQMETGADHSAVALQEAMFARTRIFREIQGWFDTYDIRRYPDFVAHRIGDRP